MCGCVSVRLEIILSSHVLFAFVLCYRRFCGSARSSQHGCVRLRCCVCVCCGGLPTYRDVSPELGHVVVVAAEELGEPADGPLAAFVHRFISFKVLIVFVDGVVRQMHVELALWRETKGVN